MSQTNINTNTWVSNTNWNQITRRGGQGQGGSGGRGYSGREGNCGNNSIARYLFEGKLKDGCISKLPIIENGHGATQYKNNIDILPNLCADKNYRCIDDVLCNWTDLDVGIQTAALLVTHWISYGHPARNKRAGYLFEFHFTNHHRCDLNIQDRCQS